MITLNQQSDRKTIQVTQTPPKTVQIRQAAGLGPAGQDGEDGREVEFQQSVTHIQWRYVGDPGWTNLVALIDLKGDQGDQGIQGIQGVQGIQGDAGSDGREVEFNKSVTHIQWRYVGEVSWINLVPLADIKGDQGDQGIQGIQGVPGEDGETVQIQNNGTYIQWKYPSDAGWTNLILLSDLKGDAGDPGPTGGTGATGAPGSDGSDGADGREVELQVTGTHIQWRYVGGSWTNLVALSTITGPQGAPGNDGADGADGEDGWSPVFAVVADSSRRVLQVADWTGGTGTKPTTGLYVGPTGFEASIANGVDIRGPEGAAGAGSGDMSKSTYDTDDDGKVNAADTADSVPWSGVTSKPSTFPPDTHTHAFADITSKPSTYPPDSHTHPWSDVTSKPSTFPPDSHTHTASEITDFDAEVANNSAVTANTAKVSYTDGAKVAGIEAGADVTDAANVGSSIHGVAAKTTPVDADTVPLIDSADSNVLKKLSWANIKTTLKTYFDTLYATGSHTHAWSAITDKPSTFPPDSHSHAASDITSGTIGTARLGSGTANSTKVLYGDSTWKDAPGMVYPGSGIPVSTGSGWSTSKSNPSGDLVGTTATQTLTNKTLTGYTETVFAITDATTVTPNPANGTIQTWTLGANRTLSTASIGAGQSLLLMINDGSARTITWTTVVWVGGSAPALATSGYTCIELWKVGSTCYGALIGEVA